MKHRLYEAPEWKMVPLAAPILFLTLSDSDDSPDDNGEQWGPLF